MSKENIQRLGIEHRQIINDLPVGGREEFLEYHKNIFFKVKKMKTFKYLLEVEIVIDEEILMKNTQIINGILIQ